MATPRTLLALLGTGFWLCASPCPAQGNIYLTGHDTLHHFGQAGYDIVILDFLRNNTEPRATYSIGVIGSGVGSWSFSTATSGYPAPTVYDTNSLATSAALRAQAVSHDVLIVLSHVSCVGCSLTSAGSDVINQLMALDIMNAFNAGMDIWANSGGTHPTYYDFLPPDLVPSAPAITGNTFCATPAGTAIGITANHTTGYATHNQFTGFSPLLTVCEMACAGPEVISLCGAGLSLPPPVASIRKEVRNNAGVTVHGIEFEVEGSFTYVNDTVDGGFPTFTLIPSGPNTKCRWMGLPTPPGAVRDVGVSLNAENVKLVGLSWLDNTGAVAGCPAQVNSAYAGQLGGNGVLNIRNDVLGCISQTLHVGDIRIDYYDDPPPLNQTGLGGTTPEASFTSGEMVTIPPGGEVQVPIAVNPPPPPGVCFGLITFKVATTPSLANPTVDALLARIEERGATELTTPPNFAADNGGVAGGMIYFSLDVLATNGVRIAGLDANTSTTGWINGLVYRHRTITDWTLLTSANNGPGDWDALGCLTGFARPTGTASPLAIVNGTNSLDLPMGQHLLAVGDGNFDHRYTDGNGPNQTVSDGTLSFSGGKAANVVNSTTFFMPRVFNSTFHYDVPSQPVTLSPPGPTCAVSTCVENGITCGGDAATIYEEFDGLNPWDLTGATRYAVTLSPDGLGGVDLQAAASSQPILTPLGEDLGLADDEVSELIPLGFSADLLGVCADAIAVDSNGCVWLGVRGFSDFSQTAGEFESLQARLAPFWTDLQPFSGGGGGTIHVDVGAGSAVVTWSNVFLFGNPLPLTFQVQIVDNTGGDVDVTFVYDNASLFPDDAIVGYHNGVPQTGTASSDLNAGPVLNVAAASPDLSLTCNQLPVAGGALKVILSGVPMGGLGAVLAEHALNGPGVVPSVTGWDPACLQYVSNSTVSLGFTTACTSTFTITMPPSGTSFLGTVYGLQGVASAFGPFRVISSNGIDARLGNY